jgi:hypothetical protein
VPILIRASSVTIKVTNTLAACVVDKIFKTLQMAMSSNQTDPQAPLKRMEKREKAMSAYIKRISSWLVKDDEKLPESGQETHRIRPSSQKESSMHFGG